jgi:hypothetical protein
MVIDPNKTTAADEAATIIANLIATMSVWDQANLNAVRVALVWLRDHDHPELWLNAAVRHMMETGNVG